MKSFVIIILAGLLLFSCTKYEKGPKISFKLINKKSFWDGKYKAYFTNKMSFCSFSPDTTG